MPLFQQFSDVEKWTINQLVDACEPEPRGKYRITIPEFQRRLVWSKNKQELLISSIKQGFPIGSLLLYEDVSASQGSENKRHYKLIDGLQRTQALRLYAYRPTSFFTRDDVTNDVVEAAGRFLNEHSVSDEEIVKAYVNWVKGLSGFNEKDGWGVDGVLTALINTLKYDEDSEDFMRAYMKISRSDLLKEKIAQFLADVREAADIGAAELPIIIYNGDASELPNVFELLNSQGVALSRYEIYAAQWMDERQKINNEKIVNAIWKKYEALEDEGFTLDVSDEASTMKARRNRRYTLFEYLFGLGQFLADQYPKLFKAVSDDRPSSLGFNLVCACVGLSVKEMDKLPDRLGNLERNTFEDAILDSIDFIWELFKPILAVSQSGKRKASIYHSEYQIVSMIATAFIVKYDLNNDLAERTGWKQERKNLEYTLKMFYLYDILREYWKGTGDVKLYEVVSNQRYLKEPPTMSNWQQVLDSWFADTQLVMQHAKRYVRDATPEILLLKYIYVHKLTIAENAKDYDIEHIVPVDQLTDLLGKEDKIAINAVSNLALLTAKDNRSKGNRSFKEQLDRLFEDGQLDQDEYQEYLKEMEQQLICKADILPIPLNFDTYDEFLFDRFDFLKHAFFEAWQQYIPSDDPGN